MSTKASYKEKLVGGCLQMTTSSIVAYGRFLNVETTYDFTPEVIFEESTKTIMMDEAQGRYKRTQIRQIFLINVLQESLQSSH